MYIHKPDSIHHYAEGVFSSQFSHTTTTTTTQNLIDCLNSRTFAVSEIASRRWWCIESLFPGNSVVCDSSITTRFNHIRVFISSSWGPYEVAKAAAQLVPEVPRRARRGLPLQLRDGRPIQIRTTVTTLLIIAIMFVISIMITILMLLTMLIARLVFHEFN